MIKYLLTPLKPFALVDVQSLETIVQTLIAMILKNCKVSGSDNTGLTCCLSKLNIVNGELSTNKKASLILCKAGQRLFIRKFLTACLYGKVCLCHPDNGLSVRICILQCEVTSISRQVNIFHFACCS